MRWEDFRRSTNVVDERGEGPAAGGGGGGFRIPIGGSGGLGIGGLIILGILALVFGVDPRALLSGLGGEDSSPAPQTQQ
jgi:predicted metalloprotease